MSSVAASSSSVLAQPSRRLLRQIDQAAAEVRSLEGIVDLQAAIIRYLAETVTTPSPFLDRRSHAVIEKVRRGKQALESIR
jgi:hypothetical protein